MKAKRFCLFKAVGEVVLIMCIGCTAYMPIDEPVTEEQAFKQLFEGVPDGALLALLGAHDKLCTPHCPFHGYPDRAVLAYAADIAILSTNLAWGSEVKVPGQYWSSGRLLALACADNRLQEKCKYKILVDHLRIDASSNICEIVNARDEK